MKIAQLSITETETRLTAGLRDKLMSKVIKRFEKTA